MFDPARTTWVAVLGLVAVAGCGFSPTFLPGTIRCQESRDCPPSFVCAAQLCQPSQGQDAGPDSNAGGRIGSGGSQQPDAAPGTGGAGGVSTGSGGVSTGSGGVSTGSGGVSSGGGGVSSGSGGLAGTGGGGPGGRGGAATGGAATGSGGAPTGSGGRTGTGGAVASGGAGGSVPVCGNNIIEAGETCDRNCPTTCPTSGCTRRHLAGTGCNVTCVDDPAEIRCQGGDGCCPGAARGCNAANDAECGALCGNSVTETGETCDPPAACQTMAQACVSNANTVRTPTGDAAACTFRCDSMSRACVGGDGFCPTGCSRPGDTDCPKEPAEACGAPTECRLGFCTSAVCCDRACTGACEACNRPGKVGTCSLPDASDPDNCGSCGGVCSTSHMAARMCAGGMCVGACATGFGDCNSDKRADGCETDTTSSAAHCGACNSPCKYGFCQANACPFTRHGLFNPGASSANRFAATMYCHRVHTSVAGRLAALGINVGVNATAGIAFRLGLYTSSSDAPLTLVTQTADLASVSSAPVEGFVSIPSLPVADYWLCLLTSATLRVTTEATLTGPVYSGAGQGGTFPATAPVLTRTADVVITNVFAVTTP